MVVWNEKSVISHGFNLGAKHFKNVIKISIAAEKMNERV